MTDLFHIDIVAMSYKISKNTIRKRARKLGIIGKYFTDDQAFDIANYGHQKKYIVEVIRIHEETIIIPSKANFLSIEMLPQWPI